MTVGSEVKQVYATLKGIEASLSSLAMRSEEQESSRVLHEAMLIVSQVKKDVRSRVGELEREELQYKGF